MTVKPKAGRQWLVIATIVTLCLAVGAFAIAVYVARALPAPTGPYAVGTTTLTMDRPAKPRSADGTFAVTVWYPSEPSNDRAPYALSGPGLKRFIYYHLIRTHAGRDAALVTNGERFPLLLYVAGWGSDAGANTVLGTELASHGYVVAALSDTGFDRPPYESLAGAADFSSAQAFAASRRLAREKLDYEAQRGVRVLEFMSKLDASDPSHRFTHRLELARSAVFGFSLGGAVALDVCNRVIRCAGALDMDGYLWDVHKARAFPYFLISDLEPLPSATELASSDPLTYYSARMDAADDLVQRANLSSGGYLLQIAGANHLNFTDVPLYSPGQQFKSAISPAGVALLIDRYALAFFDTSVKGRSVPLLGPSAGQPEGGRFEAWPRPSKRAYAEMETPVKTSSSSTR